MAKKKLSFLDFFRGWWRGLVYAPWDPRYNSGKSLKIAVIGGGTGLSMLLRGLKNYSKNISAIVAVTDDGSSSGVIRREFDILPPGDIRKCISALTYDEDLFSEILEYRFPKGEDKLLSGHTLGNVWITALTRHFGSFEKALEATSKMFESAGVVYPATLDSVDLWAKYEDGTTAQGESNIPKEGKRVEAISLNKKGIRVYSRAKKALLEADIIILGPGSLYTSLIPNLLIHGIRASVRKNRNALRVYVSNVSTERGETEGYSVRDHLEAIKAHAGSGLLDWVLVNNKILKRSKKAAELGEINNITTNKEDILGAKIYKADVVDEKNPLYHDSNKLAREIINLYNKVVDNK